MNDADNPDDYPPTDRKAVLRLLSYLACFAAGLAVGIVVALP